jgi:hypothetical protein
VQCYRLKSAALYGAGAKMGGILTGADDDESSSLQAAGVDLGLSYQFLDDVADVIAGVAEVGKEAGHGCGKVHRRRCVRRRRREAEELRVSAKQPVASGAVRAGSRLAAYSCLGGELEGELKGRLILDVEGLGAGGLAVLVERDLLNARLGLA